MNWDRDFLGFIDEKAQLKETFSTPRMGTSFQPLLNLKRHEGLTPFNGESLEMTSFSGEQNNSDGFPREPKELTGFPRELKGPTGFPQQANSINYSTRESNNAADFSNQLFNRSIPSLNELFSQLTTEKKVPPQGSYQLMRTIGTGSYGRVHLAQHTLTCQYFALKVLSKAEIIRGNQLSHVRHEKEVLASLQHPFIVRLVDSCQDEGNLYMVMEYVPGGELFSMLKKFGVSFPLL